MELPTASKPSFTGAQYLPAIPQSLGEGLAHCFARAIAQGADIEKSLTAFFEAHRIPLSPVERRFFLEGLPTLYLKETKAPQNPSGPLDQLEIKQNIIERIEHGPIGEIKAIVLHQTDTATAKATFNVWKKHPGKVGAHFVIDTDGKIFQTAGLDRKTWHVGRLRSRCENEKNCSKDDATTYQSIRKSETSTAKINWKIHHKEKKKNYPKRYPLNQESLAIEVVSLFDKKNGYPPATPEQKKSLDLLVNALMKNFNITSKDVYTHGRIAIKQKSEAAKLGY